VKNIFFFKGLQFFDIQRTQYTFTSATTVGPEVEQAVVVLVLRRRPPTLLQHGQRLLSV
jgi:hypothetical protein